MKGSIAQDHQAFKNLHTNRFKKEKTQRAMFKPDEPKIEVDEQAYQKAFELVLKDLEGYDSTRSRYF